MSQGVSWSLGRSASAWLGRFFGMEWRVTVLPDGRATPEQRQGKRMFWLDGMLVSLGAASTRLT